MSPQARLVGRRGKKRALVAVAHRLLVIVYNVLKKGQVYQEPVQATPEERLHTVGRMASLVGAGTPA